MITAIGRILVSLAALLGLFAGVVLLYAVVQQEFAERAVAGEALFGEAADAARQASTDHWQAAAGAWRLAGFEGRAAEAEARAALTLPMLDSEQRDATVTVVKYALNLRPTQSNLWQSLAELNALTPVNPDGLLAAMRMAQLTAPRELPQGIARARFILRNWGLINTEAALLREPLQDMLIQDLSVSAPTVMDLNARSLRGDLVAIGDDDRFALRELLVSRIGEKRTSLLIHPPPPPRVVPPPIDPPVAPQIAPQVETQAVPVPAPPPARAQRR